jgi:hypothetical protein
MDDLVWMTCRTGPEPAFSGEALVPVLGIAPGTS